MGQLLLSVQCSSRVPFETPMGQKITGTARKTIQASALFFIQQQSINNHLLNTKDLILCVNMAVFQLRLAENISWQYFIQNIIIFGFISKC